MIGIYIHIPFCRTRCPYCDFVRQPIPGGVPEEYIEGLRREIEGFEGPGEAATVFLGGGTPSLLDEKKLGRILGAVARRFTLEAPEISIEANPDDVTPGLAEAWLRQGVNRVSLGVQSFNDDVLRYLGRRHDAASARRACRIVTERFDNWTMDLIFGAVPVATWESTLEECVALGPKHVSTYGLTYERGTPFETRAGDAAADDTWLALYHQADQALAGFDHYEISNFALPGYECRHNLLYWHNEEYAGFGQAAYSFIDGVRSRNAPELAEYLANPGTKSEALQLSNREIRLETVIQHLRLHAGLPKAYYVRRFGTRVEGDFGAALRGLLERGLIAEDGDAILPTRAGFDLNNEIGLALVEE